MSSPNRLNFEDIPETPGDNGLPPPDSPLISESMIAPGSPVAAPDSPVAAAAPSYYLDGPEQPSPSREELERLYRELGTSGSIRRDLFPEAENEDEEDPEVAMLEERFGEELINAYVVSYGAGWIDAIKRSHGYDSSKYGLVPIIVAAAPAGASGKKRKKTTKKKGKRQRKRGGGEGWITLDENTIKNLEVNNTYTFKKLTQKEDWPQLTGKYLGTKEDEQGKYILAQAEGRGRGPDGGYNVSTFRLSDVQYKSVQGGRRKQRKKRTKKKSRKKKRKTLKKKRKRRKKKRKTRR